MQDSPKLVPEDLTLLEVKYLSGHIHIPESFDGNFITEYKIDHGIQFAFKVAENLVKIEISLKVGTISRRKNKNEAVAEFSFAFIFLVNNLEGLLLKNEEHHHEMHPALAHTLASIVYSTSRGILLTRLQGTSLSSFILPVINTANLFKVENSNS